MRSLLITVMVLMLATFAFAQDSKIVYGLGVDVTLYDTKNVDVIPAQTVGFSTNLKDLSGAFSFVIPHEALITFSYGWATDKGEENKTSYYVPAIYGFWYFTDRTENQSKWQPFFVMAGNYVIESTENEGTVQKLSGEFGLGTNYKFNDNWGLITKHTFNVGSEVFYHSVFGFYFNI